MTVRSRVWDVATGDLRETLPGSALEWSRLTGRFASTFLGPQTYAALWSLSPDGRQRVTASWDAHVWVADAITGTLHAQRPEHADWITGLVWNRDGSQIIAVGQGERLWVWEMTTGKLLKVTSGGIGSDSPAISPNGTKTFTLDEGGIVRILDAATGDVIAQLPGALMRRRGVLTARGWRWPCGTARFRFGESELCGGSWGLIAIIAALVVATVQPSVRAQDPGPGPYHEIRTLGRGAVYSVAWSPDGQMIAAGSTQGIWLYTSELEDIALLTNGAAGEVYDLDFSPDGTRLVSSGPGDKGSVWDVSARKWLFDLSPCGDNTSGPSRGIQTGARLPAGEMRCCAAVRRGNGLYPGGDGK